MRTLTAILTALALTALGGIASACPDGKNMSLPHDDTTAEKPPLILPDSETS
jgi:hypothetical protein